MNIQHQTKENEGRFYIEENGNTKAELAYSKSKNGGMSIDHTEVSKELRGQSIGKRLVERAVEYARENGLELNPRCSYAKTVIERNEKLQDVLKK